MQRVRITGTDMLRFTPARVRVNPGPVQVTLVDMGAYPHNIVIPGLRVTSGSVTGDPGGRQTVFTIDFPRAGRYRFYCQYHASAGMVGTFVVS